MRNLKEETSSSVMVGVLAPLTKGCGNSTAYPQHSASDFKALWDEFTELSGALYSCFSRLNARLEEEARARLGEGGELGPNGEPLVVCIEHSQEAESVCGGCHAYLCRDCHIVFGGNDLCPECYDKRFAGRLVGGAK
jgi:hypothetical protein